MRKLDSLDKWLSQGISTSSKQQLSHLYTKVQEVKLKWLKQFENSIQLWVTYVFLRMQTIFSQQLIENNQSGHQFQKVSKQVQIFISQSQIAVLKGLKNIEKLYMTPNLNINLKIQKSEVKEKNAKSDVKLLQKGRSTSLNSNGRGRKYSLFSSIKGNKNETKKNSSKIQQQSRNSTSTISKHYRPKPKYDQPTSCSPSMLGIQTKQNFNENVPEQLSRELADRYFCKKQKKSQKQLLETFSNKIDEKLSCIQSDLKSKLNIIISNLSSFNQKSDKSALSREQFPSNFSTKRQQHQLVSEKSRIQVTVDGRERIKRSSMGKKITSNPIIDENSFVDNIQLTANKQNIQSNQQKYDPISNCQLQHNGRTNVGGQKLINSKLHENQKKRINQLELEFKQKMKNWEQFVSMTKKVKLPINETLLRILGSSCITRFKQWKQYPNWEQLQLQKSEPIDANNYEKFKIQLKQCMLKLKKLVSMNGINDKVEKIKIYLRQCLICCYQLYLGQQYQLSDQIAQEIDKLLTKL